TAAPETAAAGGTETAQVPQTTAEPTPETAPVTAAETVPPETAASETDAETPAAETEPAGPSAEVCRTENGIAFTANEKSKGDGKTFSVTSGLTLTFDGALTENFNRMTFTYSAGRALKIAVTYTVSGAETTDEFYLEAGDRVTFRGLIAAYPEGAAANDLRTLTVGTCDGKATDFTLWEIGTETADVYPGGTYWLENDRFRVGVQLSLGGGIDWIEDKTCGVGGLTNLINRHDTGRLVQQSYYGTSGNSEYRAGRFNGSAWVYNPVQGGDQYGNRSRLIDFRVSGNSVYIKSQPQDWALNGRITKSYMENTYTLSENTLRVDNRFVDFSGWTHQVRDQELPAFYTVSCLDRFTWYNGAAPWTDGPLSSRDGLGFWGDPAIAPSCRFFLREGNTETWCAWTSSASGFGIGLYVPAADSFTAGRYRYNGSADSSDDAANYVAPINRFRLVSFEPLTYSYLITTGTVAEIRETFRQNRDFASNASLRENGVSLRVPVSDAETLTIDLSVGSDRSALIPKNGTEFVYLEEERALRLTVADAHDPQVMIEVAALFGAVEAKDYRTLEIDYRIPAENQKDGYEADFFLCTGAKAYPDGSERTRATLIKDGLWHTVTVDLAALPFWQGTVNRIRFDYFDSSSVGDEIYIRSIRLT
ncbi:MAG: hypothetical protein IJR89_08455, partial [Clostridia bacterium]|nr:hypothetical protein [Clostridia bacterium]